MALPAWDTTGLLPPGAHKADLSDIYERFVLDAPVSSRDQRELLFGALTIHLRLIQKIIPAGVAWMMEASRHAESHRHLKTWTWPCVRPTGMR